MAGVLLMAGPFADSHSSPCLCVDSFMPSSSCSMNVKRSIGELGFRNNLMGRRRQWRKLVRSDDLTTSFLDAWYEWRLSTKLLSAIAYGSSIKRRRKFQNLRVVDEFGGQYEDTFNDVKMHILNYFTYKAVRTVLYQLYEMNPPQYMWFYNFVAANDSSDGKRFMQILVKEKQELAERVMVTRLHLYGKWIKKCDHAEMYKEISDENLKLMRERLMETIIWPSDDTSTGKMD